MVDFHKTPPNETNGEGAADEGEPYATYRARHAEQEREAIREGHADALVRCLTADEFFAPESDANLVVPALGICPGPPLGLIGQAYAGKTIAALSFGLSIVFGKDLWGVWSVQQGPWLHLDYEQGRRHTKSRVRRLARGMGVDDEQLRALIVAGVIRIAVFPDLRLTTDKAADHFKRAFEGVRLVTCDSLRMMLGGVDENSSQVRGLMGAVSSASDATGAAACIIHHGGKSPKEGESRSRKEMSRGSSAIIDEFQSMLVMSKKKGDAVALVTHEKDRELGHEAEDFGLRIDDVPGGQNGEDPKWGLRVVHVDREQMKSKADTGDADFARAMDRVTKCVGDNPGIAGADATAERMKLRRSLVGAVIKQLISDEVVVQLRGRRGVKLYLKHAAPAGKLSLVPTPEGEDND